MTMKQFWSLAALCWRHDFSSVATSCPEVWQHGFSFPSQAHRRNWIYYKHLIEVRWWGFVPPLAHLNVFFFFPVYCHKYNDWVDILSHVKNGSLPGRSTTSPSDCGLSSSSGIFPSLKPSSPGWPTGWQRCFFPTWLGESHLSLSGHNTWRS